MGSNPWTYLVLFIVAIVGGAVILGAAFSLLMAFLGSRFADKTQEKYVKKIESLLPGKNCGACGYADCRAYADAALHNLADDDLCPCGAASLPQSIDGCRKQLLTLMEDPTPPQEREEKKSYWNRKF